MGCGPQVVKSSKCQSASAIQKKYPTDKGSYLNVKVTPPSLNNPQ